MSTAPLTTPLQVAILVFDQMEVLDFAGPYEVFTTASRVHQRTSAQAPAASAPLCEVRAVARTLAWIARLAATAQITASVCTGSFLLAASGVLRHERVTTHWEDLEDLHHQFPALQVCDTVRWVDQGRVVSSAGISAGMDMSLHLVARLGGEALALRTARQMDYAWNRQA